MGRLKVKGWAAYSYERGYWVEVVEARLANKMLEALIYAQGEACGVCCAEGACGDCLICATIAGVEGR